jgi:uncharacterized protein GlcG (DUF336 family)
MEEAIATGKQAFLSVEGIVPMQGGLPVIVDDKVNGAVGVSGVTSARGVFRAGLLLQDTDVIGIQKKLHGA